MQSNMWRAAILGAFIVSVALPALGQWSTNAAGYPDITGEWREGGVAVRIVQRGANFTATSSRGNISWRMEGAVSRDGVVKGALIHTSGASPGSRGYTQERTMTLSQNGLTLQGNATFSGGSHPVTWTRTGSIETFMTDSERRGSQPRTPRSQSDSPDISGEWREGGAAVQIVQRGANFTATSSRGNISWRMEGTVSRDGVVKGTLTHTSGASPGSRGYTQERTMTLSQNGLTLQGDATFSGGSHPVTWTRTTPGPGPSTAGRSACGLGTSWKVVAGCWPGVYTRRGSSNTFDAEMTHVNGDRYSAVVVVTMNGAQVSATQTDTNGGRCILRNGLLNADGRTITGTYECSPSAGRVVTGCFVAAIQCN